MSLKAGKMDEDWKQLYQSAHVCAELTEKASPKFGLGHRDAEWMLKEAREMVRVLERLAGRAKKKQIKRKESRADE